MPQKLKLALVTAISDWLPDKNIILLIDVFDDVYEKQSKIDLELLINFLKKARELQKVSIIVASNLPLTLYRPQINAQNVQEANRRELSELFNEYESHIFDRIFSYKWQKVLTAFPNHYESIRLKLGVNYTEMREIIEDCYSTSILRNKAFHNSTMIPHPFFFRSLKMGLRFDSNFITLEQAALQTFHTSYDKFYKELKEDYLYQDNRRSLSEGNYSLNYLQTAGKLRPPDWDLTMHPIVFTREVRNAIKFIYHVFYKLPLKPSKMEKLVAFDLVLVLSLQEEAIYASQGKPFKTIIDILDIWWFLNGSTYRFQIVDPFPKFFEKYAFKCYSPFYKGIKTYLVIESPYKCIVFCSAQDQEQLNGITAQEFHNALKKGIKPRSLARKNLISAIDTYDKVQTTQDTSNSEENPNIHQSLSIVEKGARFECNEAEQESKQIEELKVNEEYKFHENEDSDPEWLKEYRGLGVCSGEYHQFLAMVTDDPDSGKSQLLTLAIQIMEKMNKDIIKRVKSGEKVYAKFQFKKPLPNYARAHFF